MNKFNPEKVHLEYRDYVTQTSPISGRRYTLTHSDATGDLFLTVGREYAFDKIGPMRDEVLGEWICEGCCSYIARVHVDDPVYPENNEKRNRTFVRELPLALKVIYYGDQKLFDHFPSLNSAPIWIFFHSADPKLKRWEYWGTFIHYHS